MAVEVRLTMSSEAFLFGQVFEELPAVHLELDRVVPLGDMTEVIPFVWVQTDEPPETIVETLEDAAGVSDCELVHSSGNQHLLRLTWRAPDIGFLQGLRETEGAIIAGYAEDHLWSLTLRFATHDDLSEFSTYCSDAAIRFDVTQVTGFGGSPVSSCVLSTKQREALELAVREGYFDVPRRVSLDELADDVGLSHQAYSERLRRGIDTLARTYFETNPARRATEVTR